jgi:hypothetical protein
MRCTVTAHTFNTEGSVRAVCAVHYTREIPEFL